MAQTSWLRRTLESLRKPAAKPVAVSNDIVTVSTFTANRPAPVEDFDPKTLTDEGYRKNVIVYICVNEIAQSAATPRYYLRDRKTMGEVEEHPLLDLFARPAPGLSWYELVERLLIHQQTAGSAYLHKGRAAGNQIVQLTAVRPERMAPVPDRDGNVLYYEYKIEGSDPQRVEPEDIASFSLPDPLNDFHGLSPLNVCAIYGDIDAAAAIYLRDFFANGAMPMGLLKFKQPSVRREDRLRVQAEWNEVYGTGQTIDPRRPGRWHNVGVVGGDVEYQPLALEPAQLRLDSVWGQTESRICAAFGVPPQLVAAKIGLQFSTYSNQREARRSFWSETLLPIYRRLSDGLTRNVVSEVDEGLEFCFDLDSIPELQEDLNLRADRATKLYLSGLASFNEARALADLEESKTDYFLKPGAGQLVTREDMESGAVAEAAKAAREAIASGVSPFAPKDDDEEPPSDEEEESPEDEEPPTGEPPAEEGQGSQTFEVNGVGTVPPERDREIQSAAASLAAHYHEAVRLAIGASDERGLGGAIERGEWRADKHVGVDVFVSRWMSAVDEHLHREAARAAELHYRHHVGTPWETHASPIKGIPPKWADRILTRIKTETKVLTGEVRDVVRSQILSIVNGKAKEITPASILNAIGLSPRQMETVERARQRLLKEGKLKGRALEKDLDNLRVKLLRERAELIALNETRRAHAIGQQVAWERLFAEGKLKGGRRAWHKMWVVHESEGTCAECMDLDGEERPLNKTFLGSGGEYNGPPEPHPHCACSLVLVRAE